MSKSRPTASEFALAEFDPQLESRFFQRIILANGYCKTTDAHRLDDLNAFVLPYMRRLVQKPLNIMDVAVSSGISTQEWYDYLSAEGVQANIVGTDSTIHVWHLPGRFIDILFDRNKNVIHLGLLGRGIGNQRLKDLRSRGLNVLVRAFLKVGVRARPLNLLSKAVRDVSVIEEEIENISGSHAAHFDVIRAANILNLKYFSESRLRHMIKLLSRRLRTGGLFIVCRTHLDGSNHASLFRFDADGFTKLDRLGNASEIDHIISSTDASPSESVRRNTL